MAREGREKRMGHFLGKVTRKNGRNNTFIPLS
jgi:hypothetical protein